MPKLTGSAGQQLARRRLVALPPSTPVQVVMPRRRRPNGFGPNQPVTAYCPISGPLTASTLPIEDERAADLLRNFRREMRACDERACDCTCHCHAGAGLCYIAEGLSDGNLHRFHYRLPNEAHKRVHRECPKEGREHNRR